MTETYKYIFKANGFYFGFIYNDFLYSRDGVYLGWAEGKYIWDRSGQFRGELTTIDQQEENYYILKNMFVVTPIPKTPKFTVTIPQLPPPKSNLNPSLNLPVGYKDGF